MDTETLDYWLTSFVEPIGAVFSALGAYQRAARDEKDPAVVHNVVLALQTALSELNKAEVLEEEKNAFIDFELALPRLNKVTPQNVVQLRNDFRIALGNLLANMREGVRKLRGYRELCRNLP